MKKNILFFLLILLVIFLAKIQTSFFTRDKRTDEKLNVVLISIDTLRSDHMSVYGYSKKTTPHIDKLSQNATIYTNFYTSSPSTYPSIASFMTGRSPFENKVYYNGGFPINDTLVGIKKIPNEAITLAENFQANGYKTAAFHTNYVLRPEFTGLNRGFAIYEGLDGWDSKNEYSQFVNRSITWLEDNSEDNFFLWIHLMDPHLPYMPDDKFLCTFNKKYCGVISKTGVTSLENERKQIEGCQVANLSDETIQLYQTLYDGAIATSDEFVGNIKKILEKKGIDDNTIIVIYGDHGESFSHDYYFKHERSLYESTLKIPLIVYNPKMPKNIIDSRMQNHQIFQTLLKDSGIPYRITDKRFVNEPLYAINMTMSKYAVIENNYKFILSATEELCKYKGFDQELYNITNDPDEEKNLIMIEPERANALRTKLLAYLKKYNLPQSIDEFARQVEEDKVIEKEAIERLKELGY